MKKLKKDKKEILYKVVEKSTKHSYIKPQNGYILITKSKRMNLEYIINRILNNFDYYYNLTKKQDETVLYLWGIPYNLKITLDKKFSYQISGSEVLVKSKTLDYLKIKELVLKDELKKYLNSIYDDVRQKLKEENYYEVPIKLKLLKSKFGSYNVNKGNEYIVLNVFLATLKREFSLYVLYHEFVHQRVKNHQKEFYLALDKLFKEHRFYQRKIKEIQLII